MKGQKLIIPMENKNINVTVSDTIFLDKDNKRLNAWHFTSKYFEY